MSVRHSCKVPGRGSSSQPGLCMRPHLCEPGWFRVAKESMPRGTLRKMQAGPFGPAWSAPADRVKSSQKDQHSFRLSSMKQSLTCIFQSTYLGGPAGMETTLVFASMVTAFFFFPLPLQRKRMTIQDSLQHPWIKVSRPP